MEFLVMPQFTSSLVECFSASGGGCTHTCIGEDCTFTCTCFEGDKCNDNNPCAHIACGCNDHKPCPCNQGYACIVKGCVTDYVINGVG